MAEVVYDLIVCGDSFCSASVVDLKMVGRRAHFSDILEDRYGLRVLNLAHGGVGNTCILFQMQQAQQLKPGSVIYNRTWSSRLDVVLNNHFNLEKGLANFAYFDPSNRSYHTSYVGTIERGASILNAVRNCAEQSPFYRLSQQQLRAYDMTLVHMFHEGLATELHRWLFEYWHQRLESAGITAIDFRDDDIGKVAYDFCLTCPNYDTPWHTDRATQDIIAANVYKRLTSAAETCNITT